MCWMEPKSPGKSLYKDRQGTKRRSRRAGRRLECHLPAEALEPGREAGADPSGLIVGEDPVLLASSFKFLAKRTVRKSLSVVLISCETVSKGNPRVLTPSLHSWHIEEGQAGTTEAPTDEEAERF